MRPVVPLLLLILLLLGMSMGCSEGTREPWLRGSPGDPSGRNLILVEASGDLTWVLAFDPLTGGQAAFLRQGTGDWFIPGDLPSEVGFAALGPDGFLVLGDDDGLQVSLMASDNGGRDWEPRHPVGTSATYGLHRGPDGTLYALFDHTDRFLSVSKDRGQTWERLAMEGWIDFRKMAEQAFVTGSRGDLAILFETGMALRSAGNRSFVNPSEVAARRVGAGVLLDDGAFLATTWLPDPGNGHRWGGLWLRSSDGTSRFPQGVGLPTDTPVRQFLVRGNTVVAVFWDALYQSTDRGDSWTKRQGGYPWESDPRVEINDATLRQDTLLVASSVGLFEIPLE